LIAFHAVSLTLMMLTNKSDHEAAI